MERQVEPTRLLIFKNMRCIYLILLASVFFQACISETIPKAHIELNNPIIPGYFADPSIVEYEGKFFIYATVDPWGAEFLGCWVSEDFQNWTFHKLNWPTKAACTSEKSNHNNVWAPSVIRKGNTFYMYVSVGSEVWCGKADHPLGPWKNILDNKPMILFDTSLYYHVIDAEAYIGSNGKAYLYWGSGWEWVNGHCFVAELNEDMSSVKTEPKEITPSHYFEAPFMVKHNGKYFLTYSQGKTIDKTYEVRYAIGDNPLGPFIEADNSPILKTNDSLQVYGPGHHTIFDYKEKHYILYHRHSLPFVTGTALRQICINELAYDDTTLLIKNISPALTVSFPNLVKEEIEYIKPKLITASSEQNKYLSVKNIIDDNNATRWEPSSRDNLTTIICSFEDNTHFGSMKIKFEYPWKDYFIKIESSTDEKNWKLVSNYSEYGISGSPVSIPINDSATFIRITFNKWDNKNKPSIWKLSFIK